MLQPSCLFLFAGHVICGLLTLCCYETFLRWALLIDWGTQDVIQPFCEGKVGCCFCVCVFYMVMHNVFLSKVVSFIQDTDVT